MDVRDIKFPDNHFDLAIDKSTIDALLCGEKSFVNVAIMIKEIQRVLKPGGIYMIISYGQPENRIFHLEREHLGFDINIYTIKKDYTVEDDSNKYEKLHYVYICKKRENADKICKENYHKVIEELESEEKIEEEFHDEKEPPKDEEETNDLIIDSDPEDNDI
jgi:ubiquinone/menaquinone biosynthesis C-methylase UbiE